MKFRTPQLSGPLSRNVFVRAIYRADRFRDDIFDPEGNSLWQHECCLWVANEYEIGLGTTNRIGKPVSAAWISPPAFATWRRCVDATWHAESGVRSMSRPLYEQYRPKDWSEVVGQDKAVVKLKAIGERSGFGGKACPHQRRTGQGKTTIGRLIAAAVAADFATIELDASEVTPADVRDWMKQFRGRPIGSNGWAVLLNEAHGLRKDTIRALLVGLEGAAGVRRVRVYDHSGGAGFAV